MILVSNANLEPAIDEKLLGTFFGMTPRESQVAALLVKGGDARTVSDRLNVSLNTAQTHVKHVLAKAGVRRQAQLAMVLLTGPASRRSKE